MSRFACKTVSLGGGTSTRVRLDLNAGVALIVASISYLDHLKFTTNRIRSVLCKECLGDRNWDE